MARSSRLRKSLPPILVAPLRRIVNYIGILGMDDDYRMTAFIPT